MGKSGQAKKIFSQSPANYGKCTDYRGCIKKIIYLPQVKGRKKKNIIRYLLSLFQKDTDRKKQ